MAKKSVKVENNFPFYRHLFDFYRENRGRIRQHYRELSRKYLDFNSPGNANAFLRQPQFEALEMYIFLKEFLDNQPIHQIFKEWSERTGQFEGRGVVAKYDRGGQVAQLGGNKFRKLFVKHNRNCSMMSGTERTFEHSEHLFENPFHIEDLAVFDDDALRHLFANAGLDLGDLAFSLCGASSTLVRRVKRAVPPSQQRLFRQELSHHVSPKEVKHAQRRVLDQLFWELTYWKTPELYEELTEGEDLHPGIFQQLDADIRGKTVLDAGAGSGRATFECLRHGATLVYAVEPSPGLLRLLEQKVLQQSGQQRIICCAGRFVALPLPDQCVDVALSCSAFTADPVQGGEVGLAELRRVTKHGGKIVLIWPQEKDLSWLNAQGFQHVTLPVRHPMCVRFRSLHSALTCARRFYAHNRAVVHYLLTQRRPEVPFSVIGVHPPCDYCWLEVE